MSKVSFTPIQPGDEASVTNPNALMVAVNTATGSINQENVRVEGIDERNLSLPIMTFKSYTSEDYEVKLGSGPLNAYTKIPAGSSFTGGSQTQPSFLLGMPITVSLGSSYSFAVVRYSFMVAIEGRVLGGSHSSRNEDVGFALFKDNSRITTTERHVQNAIMGSTGTLNSGRSVESVTLFHKVLHQSSTPQTHTIDLRYIIDNHSIGALNPDTGHAHITSVDDAVVVSNLTASVVYYK